MAQLTHCAVALKCAPAKHGPIYAHPTKSTKKTHATQPPPPARAPSQRPVTVSHQRVAFRPRRDSRLSLIVRPIVALQPLSHTHRARGPPGPACMALRMSSSCSGAISASISRQARTFYPGKRYHRAAARCVVNFLGAPLRFFLGTSVIHMRKMQPTPVISFSRSLFFSSPHHMPSHFYSSCSFSWSSPSSSSSPPSTCSCVRPPASRRTVRSRRRTLPRRPAAGSSSSL